MKHIVLVKKFGGIINEVTYMLSKFDREVGDKMRIEGREYIVGCVGNSRNEVIDAINVKIKDQNKMLRGK